MIKEMEVNVIYNEDCLLTMKRMADKSVDLVLTDPPYKVISGGKEDFGGFRSGFALDKENKGRIFEHNDIEISQWLPEVKRVMKDNTHGYIFVNQLNLRDYLNELEKNDLYVHRILIWDKGIKTWTQFYMKQYEFIIFFKKGKAKAINNQETSDILRLPNPQNKFHPTEKPVDLCYTLIENSSKENEIVFDPFLGCGSSAIASLKAKRNYIGIEISPEFCKIANERIKSISNPLF